METLGPLQAGPSPITPVLPARPRRSALGKAPKTVRAEAGAMLRISTTGLPPQLIAALKHAASFHNPEFYRRQNQRFSTFNTPRLICCFDATDPKWIALPRGLRDEAASLIAAAGGTLKVTSTFPDRAPIGARFTGELTAVQARAVEAMTAHPTGVLVAQPGAGKTVMACALIAVHARPTAIIVNRAELLAQWRERLETFLDLGEHAVGSLGAGKDRRGSVVDLIMLQSLAHREAATGLLDGYGLIVVDEGHAIGAPAAEAAIRKVKAERWIGLSATPYRADQMDALITMQCGRSATRSKTRAASPNTSSCTAATSAPASPAPTALPSRPSTVNSRPTNSATGRSPRTSPTPAGVAGAAWPSPIALSTSTN